MPEQHALLGPSSAARWINCPPSVRASEHVKQTTGDAAKEGTLAHLVCETLLRNYLDGKPEKKLPKKITGNDMYNQAMFDYCMSYVDEVINCYEEYKAVGYTDLFIEVMLDLTAYIPDSFGTGDAIILPSTDTLEVFDFKYGKGVKVEVEDNPQLMLYALGAINMYGMLADIKKVNLHVIQPRLGANLVQTYDVAELEKWGEEIVSPAAKLAYEGNGEFKAGSHCVFCPIRSTCRERAMSFLNSLPAGVPEKPPELNNEELGKLIGMLSPLKSWVEDTMKTCINKALDGIQFDGYKLVAGRGARVITDEKAFIEAFNKSEFKGNVYTDPALKGITDLEKLIGVKNFKQFSEFIDKKEGKPTLVPWTDKREELKLDTPEDDFKGLIGDK